MPKFLEKIQKSLHGNVRFAVPAELRLAVVRVRATPATESEHCHPRSVDSDVLVGGGFLFAPRVSCLKTLKSVFAASSGAAPPPILTASRH